MSLYSPSAPSQTVLCPRSLPPDFPPQPSWPGCCPRHPGSSLPLLPPPGLSLSLFFGTPPHLNLGSGRVHVNEGVRGVCACTNGCVQVCGSVCVCKGEKVAEGERTEPVPVPQKAGGWMRHFRQRKLSLNYSSSSGRGWQLHNSQTGLPVCRKRLHFLLTVGTGGAGSSAGASGWGFGGFGEKGW